MKTAMKKFLSLALVLVLLLSAFPMTAFAAEGDQNAPQTADYNDGHYPQWPGFGEDSEEGKQPQWPGFGEDAENDKKPQWPGFGEDSENGKKPQWPGFGEDSENGKRPGHGKDEEDDKQPAPTSLTVKFYVDGEMKEEDTVTAAATVQDLIFNYCNVDDNQTLHYVGAKINNASVELSLVVELGQEVHVYLTAQAPQAPQVCEVCGKEAHRGDCCAICKVQGHTKDAEHCAECHTYNGHTDDCPTAAMCRECFLDKNSCICCDKCDGTIYDHNARCPENERENHKNEIKFTPMLRDDNGRFYAVDPVYVKRDAFMAEVFAQVAIPAQYNFSYWSWDRDGDDVIDNRDKVPSGKEFVIYAQYAKQVQVVDGVDIRINLNYDRKMGETLKDVAKGSKMGDVMKNIQDPIRWGYKFAGWYWDRDCKNDVEWNDKVLKGCEIYAKWEPQDRHHDTMLKIYVNGETRSAAKIVDLHEYAKDGWITIDEVKEVVKKYYTAKDSNGMSYYGLFDAANWNSYLRNHRHGGSKHIEVNRFDDTTVYVMVYNAKAHTSSVPADTTNPKTGDMIMMPAAVLGLSVSALAVLFYLNKKRSV